MGLVLKESNASIVKSAMWASVVMFLYFGGLLWFFFFSSVSIDIEKLSQNVKRLADLREVEIDQVEKDLDVMRITFDGFLDEYKDYKHEAKLRLELHKHKRSMGNEAVLK